jgi:adenosine kinase
MANCGLVTDYIRQFDEEYTAQAYITTDADNNQITAFHPGAMNRAHANRVPEAAGIRSASSRRRPRRHDPACRAVRRGRHPVHLRSGPGHDAVRWHGLNRFIDQATWVAANDYEASLLCERTGLSLEQIAAKVKALIVTRGGEGSRSMPTASGSTSRSRSPERVSDPTGCGDAYRAGLLYGLQRGLDWATTGRIASLMGAIKIEQHGTQNHRITLHGFRGALSRYFRHQPVAGRGS